jgi:hypothetical protein
MLERRTNVVATRRECVRLAQTSSDFNQQPRLLASDYWLYARRREEVMGERERKR